jgi:hypothetical protein
VGMAIAPTFFAHEMVLVKFELQTLTEHPSSCRFGDLVVFVLLNIQFSVYSLFFVSQIISLLCQHAFIFCEINSVIGSK